LGRRLRARGALRRKGRFFKEKALQKPFLDAPAGAGGRFLKKA